MKPKSRKLRKGLIELVPTIAVMVIGVLLENPEVVGGSGGTFILLQVRRAIRDASQGEPE